MALTQMEKTIFSALTSGDYVNFALLEAEYEGRRAAVIVAVQGCGDGSYGLVPLAKLVDEIDQERLMLDGRPLN